MEYFCFELKSTASIDESWDSLSKAGFNLLYTSEEPNGQKHLYGYLPSEVSSSEVRKCYPVIESFHSLQFDEINWHDQWGVSKEKSFVYIDLQEYSNQKENGFTMRPGPGFGDLSHPTTQLALRMMAPLVQEKFVIDLGCGSGVLSFAAAKLGAAAVCGIDIDKDALMHANKNLECNDELKAKIHFQRPTETLQFPKGLPVVLVMNMVYQEQEIAWKSLPQLHSLPMTCITTGILCQKNQQKAYERLCKTWGWAPLECCYEGKWCGYRLQQVIL